MIQCKHKPISHGSEGITRLEKAHYPHISICKHCGQKIIPKRSWTYTAVDLLLRLGLTISFVLVGSSRAFDSLLMLLIGSVSASLCINALDYVGCFIAWKSVEDNELVGLPDIDARICSETLEKLDDIRFRG